jgi:hypothetical protein
MLRRSTRWGQRTRGVSNVDIDGNKSLQIKALGISSPFLKHYQDAVYYGTKLSGASNAKAKQTFNFTPRRLQWLHP